MTRVLALALILAAPVSAVAAATVDRAPYGVTADGRPVEVFTLANPHGVAVRVLSYGGVIAEIRTPDRQGRSGNVVLSLPDLAAYEARPNFSSLLGRYANRISGGGFTLDGVRHALPGNDKGVSSHGGPKAFSTKVWTAETGHGPRTASVTLRYRSPDGENGYPGALDVAVTYALGDDDALRLTYRATTDAPTVLNLSHHVFFNLAGEGTVEDHTLQVNADAFTPIDANKLPEGALASVAGTPFDLRRPARIGDRLSSDAPQIARGKGFDHNFVLARSRSGGEVPAVRLYDPASGRRLDVSTTQPGVQVYTGASFDGSIRDASGRPLQRHAGVALETQHFPDSPNRPAFPSTVLRPGQTFVATTTFRFSVR